MASPRNDSENRLWKLALVAPETTVDALEALVGEEAVAVSRFEAMLSDPADPFSRPATWRVEILVSERPDAAALAASLAEYLGVARDDLPRIAVEKVAAVDWLALNRAQFPPVAAGRFFVHGSHFEGRPPAGALVIRIDAGPAFGSGTHETTRGCLTAIDEILAARPQADGKLALRKALDVGCGSGILSLAIARAAGIPVIATDIDPVAAETTAGNAAANGLAALVTAVSGEGVGGEAVRRGAPYDLIVANILAEPLIALAPELAGLLAPSGHLVLSGLLTRQEPEVLAAYRAAGLTPGRTIVLGDWSTMVLDFGVLHMPQVTPTYR